MDVKTFLSYINSRQFPDYGKLARIDDYNKNLPEFLYIFKELYCQKLPFVGCAENVLVFSEKCISVPQEAVKSLMAAQNGRYGIKNAEEEIISSAALEKGDLDADLVHRIVNGLAPASSSEDQIFEMKKGFDFIANPDNSITEKNLFTLYQKVFGNRLSTHELPTKSYAYRDNISFNDDDNLTFSLNSYESISRNMPALISFINAKDDINDLVKAGIIHFYILHLKPYVDGNGIMARLLHLWFLVQKGYPSALYLPLSSRIMDSVDAYQNALTLIGKNIEHIGCIDVTPFIMYLMKHVYTPLPSDISKSATSKLYDSMLKKGKITEKEANLWQFVLSRYGTNEFSTKQLEADFRNAAYATIRSFVIKFEQFELLSCKKYGTRPKYRVR